LLQAELHYSYTFNSTTNTTEFFYSVSAGTGLSYSFTDAKSCGPVTGTVDVNQPPVLALTSAAVTTAIDCNGGKATVTIVATGGTAPYSYTFNSTTNTTEFLQTYLQELDYHIALPMRKLWTSNRNG
jgi:hypothetical protein